jgi:Immunity protein Imm1
MRRWREWVKNAYDDLVPISLFIPFEKAWPAVKEFIETDGALPRSIEWIGDRDLPQGIWPGE